MREGSTTWQAILNYCSLATVGITFFFGKLREKTQRINMSFIVLTASLLIMLIVVNSLFRAESHGLDYLTGLGSNCSIYIGLALFIILIYALLNLRKFSLRYIGPIALALIILIGLSAPKAFVLNYEVSEVEEPLRAYLGSIDTFIEAHQGEQEFTFNAVYEDPRQKHLEFKLREVIDGKNTFPEFTVPQVLYWEYWDEENPKYILIYHPEDSRLEVEWIR